MGQAGRYDAQECTLIWPVVAASQLLQQSADLDFIDKLRAFAGLSDAIFNESYVALVTAFANFVQNLPEPHMRNQPWLHVALERAVIAFNLMQAKHPDDARLLFATFSASLCLMLGRIHTELKVNLTDAQGRYLRTWQPLEQTNMLIGSFYTVWPVCVSPVQLANYVTLVLAKSLMPKKALAWINEKPNLLFQWMASLTQSSSEAGELGAVCEVAQESLQHHVFSLKNNMVAGQPLIGFMSGLQFWHWLQYGIQQKVFAINATNALIHLQANGKIFVAKQVLEAFMKSQQSSEPLAVIGAQFNHLGLAQLSGEDFVYRQKFSQAKQNKVSVSKSTSRIFSLSENLSNNNTLPPKQKTVSNAHQQQSDGLLYSGVAAAQQAFQKQHGQGPQGWLIEASLLPTLHNEAASSVIKLAHHSTVWSAVHHPVQAPRNRAD